MTRIDDLAAELCPDGVEYKPLGEVASVATGVQLNRSGLTSDGSYAVFNGGIGPSGRHSAFNTDANTVIVSQGGASAGYVNFVQEPFWAGAHCYVIDPDPLFLRTLFLYFALKASQEELQAAKLGAGIPGLSRKALLTLRLPIPPLEIQDAVVKFLETFVDLEKQLEAELEARSTQYAYYRDRLLTFPETEEIPRISMGELCAIVDGTHQTPRYTEDGVPFVSVENIASLGTTKKYISTDDFETQYKVKPRTNDLLMTRIGSIGTCAVVENDHPLAYYVTLALIRPKSADVSGRYLKHVIESRVGRSELWKRTLHTAVPIKINLGDIGKVLIPVPPREEQQRVVKILDQFDALVNDLSIGLPAELNARRKQYEHYRERLLAFREAA